MSKHTNPEDYGYLKVGGNSDYVAGIVNEEGLAMYELVKKFVLFIERNPENLYINLHPALRGITALMYFDGIFLHGDFVQLLFDPTFEKYKKQFLDSEDSIYEYYKNREFDKILMRCGRNLRPLLFNTLFGTMPDKEKFINFLTMYKQCDYGLSKMPSETIKEVCKLIPEEIVIKRKESKLIDEDEYIKVYRGIMSKSANPKRAISWTSDIEMAKWFASRYGEKGKVVSGKVYIDDIIFIFQEEYWYISPNEEYDDKEKEIIVTPGKVKDIRIIDKI